jgi:hypothetical protein
MGHSSLDVELNPACDWGSRCGEISAAIGGERTAPTRRLAQQPTEKLSEVKTGIRASGKTARGVVERS